MVSLRDTSVTPALPTGGCLAPILAADPLLRRLFMPNAAMAVIALLSLLLVHSLLLTFD
jgi:hypothetical protein